MTARLVSTSATRRSSERTPRTVVAISEPIAASDTATTESATSTSTSVKPATPYLRIARLRLKQVERDNFDASCQPINPDFVADAMSRQRNDTAARHAGRKEANGAAGRPLIASSGQQRIEGNVIRHADDPAGCTRTDRACHGIHVGDDLHPAPDRRVAIGL